MRIKSRRNIMAFAGSGVVLAVFGSIFILNRNIERKVETQTQAQIATQLPTPAVSVPEPDQIDEPRALVSSDLSGYTIAPQKQNRFANNQRYWDTMTKNMLEGAEASQNSGSIFKGTTMTPAEFQSQQSRINGRIEEYEQIVVREPDNGYAQKKLNDLYMLKASLEALKPNIVDAKR